MKRKRYLSSLVFIILMVAIAEYSGELEIIFPEILALLSGAWIAEKQPWKVKRIQLFLLMSLSSIVGVCIVRYVEVPLIIKIAIAFTFSYVALNLTKTTIVPLISACILPILLNTSTWIYPISVCTMCGLIVVVQHCMEVLEIRDKEEINFKNLECEESSQTLDEESSYKEEIIKFIKCLTLILIVAFIPAKTNNLYFIAPPLIVTFVEFSEIESPARKNVKKILLTLCLVPCVGVGFRLFFNVNLGWPLWIVAALITICIFICFEKTKVIFPPAGAIGLLPILLKTEGLELYPIQVITGSFIFIFLALYMYKEEKVNNYVAD